MVSTKRIPLLGNKFFLLDRALYGTLRGALSWETHAEGQLGEIDYTKLITAKSMYKKTVEEYLIRMHRFSDDFRVSCINSTILDQEIKLLSETMDYGAFSAPKRFLGGDFQRINMHTGEDDPADQIILIRATHKIDEAGIAFSHLRAHFKSYFEKGPRKKSHAQQPH